MYKYSRGNLLEKPNHYMYTAFEGKEFLDTFFSFRETYIKELYEKIYSNREQIDNIEINSPGGFRYLELLAIVCWSASFVKDNVSKGRLNNLEKLLKRGRRFKAIKDLSVNSEESEEWVKKLCRREQVYTLDLFKKLILITVYGDEKSVIDRYFLLNTFVKKYEVFKRIFNMYDGRSLKKIGEDYRSLTCYIYLSLTLGLRCIKKSDPKLLNTLLKINDMVCSTLTQNESYNKSYLEDILFYIVLILEKDLINSLIIEKGI